MKKTWIKTLRQYSVNIFLVVIVSGLIILLINNSYPTKPDINEDAVQDSIRQDINSRTDSIKHLDSIKNEYIDKANNLDDSDAINLFHWLLHKQ